MHISDGKTLSEQVADLEKDLRETRQKLHDLEMAVTALPNAPPGFRNTSVDKVKWTNDWVRRHWHMDDQITQLKAEIDSLRSADAACEEGSET